MSETTDPKVLKTAVEVDGRAASYLTADRDGPVALPLHGTSWSCVWLPMLDGLAEAGAAAHRRRPAGFGVLGR